MSFCEMRPSAVGRCAFLTAFTVAVLIAARKGSRFGALPSLVIGMYGVITLMMTVKRGSDF